MSEGDTYPLDRSAEMWRSRALRAESEHDAVVELLREAERRRSYCYILALQNPKAAYLDVCAFAEREEMIRNEMKHKQEDK